MEENRSEVAKDSIQAFQEGFTRASWASLDRELTHSFLPFDQKLIPDSN